MNGRIEQMAIAATKWIGSSASIIVHSFLFILISVLRLFGFSINDILLILTTAVSIEAIYLSLFIQMTVNRHAESLEDVEEDIDEIQDDIEEISEDIEQIQEEDEKNPSANLEQVETHLKKLLQDIHLMRQNKELNSGAAKEAG